MVCNWQGYFGSEIFQFCYELRETPFDFLALIKETIQLSLFISKQQIHMLFQLLCFGIHIHMQNFTNFTSFRILEADVDQLLMFRSSILSARIIISFQFFMNALHVALSVCFPYVYLFFKRQTNFTINCFLKTYSQKSKGVY